MERHTDGREFQPQWCTGRYCHALHYGSPGNVWRKEIKSCKDARLLQLPNPE